MDTYVQVALRTMPKTKFIMFLTLSSATASEQTVGNTSAFGRVLKKSIVSLLFILDQPLEFLLSPADLVDQRKNRSRSDQILDHSNKFNTHI